MYVTRRNEENPILLPEQDHYWESFAAFNMCPIRVGDEVYGVYRAISAIDHLQDPNQVSTVGVAKSSDGLHFKERKQLVAPEMEWEQYGCEDPRVTFFEGKYYIFYTALSKYPFGPEGIKVAVAVSEDMQTITERHFVTPFNSKAMALFPERIDGKGIVVFSADTDTPPAKMAIAKFDDIEELWDPHFWEEWHEKIEENTIDPRRNEHDHVEVGAPPIKTEHGWLLVYSHIQNYFHKPEGQEIIFGIEVLLLDLEDPTKVIGKTRGPVLVPNEPYELSGYISNVIFPTGSLIEGDDLVIYYGAADTTVCTANINLEDLLGTMRPDTDDEYHFQRCKANPILLPLPENEWESKAVFNPATITLGGKIHILYRALSGDNTSTIGYASTTDGFSIDERLPEPIYVPREDFEMKKIENGNSGCEDPRLTKIDDKIYMCYTAYDSVGPPRVAVSYINEEDFLAKNWNWSKPFLITPRDLDDKDTCILPDKFEDGYFIVHRVNNEVCGDYLSALDGEHDMVKKCIRIIGPRRNMWDSAKVGISAPPIKTEHGWLLLYHGVSKSHSTYRVGAVLLDLEDPAIVLARGTDPIFEPVEDYEKFGIVNNVVFPCGAEVKDGLLFIYYGGADKVIGVATMKLDVVLNSLLKGMKE